MAQTNVRGVRVAWERLQDAMDRGRVRHDGSWHTFVHEGHGLCQSPLTLQRVIKQSNLTNDSAGPLTIRQTVPCRRCRSCVGAGVARLKAAMEIEMSQAARNLLCTFTYREPLETNGTSLKRVRGDVQEWLRRARRRLPRGNMADFGIRYCAVTEFTKRGRPHVHLLLHSNSIITQQAVANVSWPHGFRDVRLVHDVKAAQYLAKYLIKVGRLSKDYVAASIRYGKQPTDKAQTAPQDGDSKTDDPPEGDDPQSLYPGLAVERGDEKGNGPSAPWAVRRVDLLTAFGARKAAVGGELEGTELVMSYYREFRSHTPPTWMETVGLQMPIRTCEELELLIPNDVSDYYAGKIAAACDRGWVSLEPLFGDRFPGIIRAAIVGRLGEHEWPRQSQS